MYLTEEKFHAEMEKFRAEFTAEILGAISRLLADAIDQMRRDIGALSEDFQNKLMILGEKIDLNTEMIRRDMSEEVKELERADHFLGLRITKVESKIKLLKKKNV